jgi:aminopeptidase N
MYYYIGDEFFSKGLKLYFQQYKWDNTTFGDFIGKMVEVAGGKLSDLGKLCEDWFKKAGLNEISLDMTIDEKTGKISKFVVKQKPCLEQFPNMITHIVDFIFIYDYKDLSKNKIFEKKIIEPKNETSFDFSNELAPKIVFLNYNDWGYMKLDLDKKSIQGLKEGLVQFKDPLTKLSIYRSLFDGFRDSKISAIEFLDIIISSIKNEKNENNLSTLLRFARSASSLYMPIKYMKEYKKKLFNELKALLESQLSSINFEKDLVKPILLYLPLYSDEENVSYLIQLMNLDPKLVSQEDRFRILRAIFSCRNIDIKDKEKLLEAEVKRDKNSEDSINAKLSCNALLPDRKNKEILWNKITKETTSDSLVNMQTIMSYFSPVEQYDLVDDFIKEKYFEVIPELGKNNESFYIKEFVSTCGPKHYPTDEMIKKYEDLIEKVKDMSQVKKYVSEECDFLKRAKKSQELCEEYMNSIGKK